MKEYTQPEFWLFLLGLIICFPGALGSLIIVTDPNETGIAPYLACLGVGIVITLTGLLLLYKRRQ